jgi:exosortase K
LKQAVARRLPFYLLAALLAVGLKQHYSTADCQQLRWILAPTAWIVSLLDGSSFAFSEGLGYVSGDGGTVIAPACAGLNFLIICFCTLAFSFMHYACTFRARTAILALSMAASLLATLAVNTGRIMLAMQHTYGISSESLLNPDQTHRMEGIAVYFLALSTIYLTAGFLVRKFLAPMAQPYPATAARPHPHISLLVPFFWYLAVLLGIPLLRGSFRSSPVAFIEHAFFVISLPAALLAAVHIIRRTCAAWKSGRVLRASIPVVACVLIISAILLVQLRPAAVHRSFNSGNNGLWVSSSWYTGISAASGNALTDEEIQSFIAHLQTNQIRYAYVRAGRINPGGTIEHMPSPAFFRLQSAAPDITFLPWIAASSSAALADPVWRDRLIQSLGKLYAMGVKGIHLNIEPLANNQPGYLELLREIDERFDGQFFLSQATVRITPFGWFDDINLQDFWSRKFTLATMQHADQSVLMGYNTALSSPRIYSAYIRHQTSLLLKWAAGVEHHDVIIGIPAFENLSPTSNPSAENIVSALSGVSAAVERLPSIPSCFKGVAIYADWCLSESDQHAYRSRWLH